MVNALLTDKLGAQQVTYPRAATFYTAFGSTAQTRLPKIHCLVALELNALRP